MKVTMKVEGLKELEAALVELAEAGAPRVLGKALRDPMLQVLADAKAAVPKRTGELHDALDLTPLRRATARRASGADALSEVGLRIRKTKTGKVGTRGQAASTNPRSIWHLVEFGTSHSAAHPYLRPAFDQNVQNLIDGFKRITAAEIERIRAKFARKGRRR